MSGSKGANIGPPAPREPKGPLDAPSPSCLSRRSTKMAGLYIPFVTAVGTGMGQVIAPDVPTQDTVIMAGALSALSCVLSFSVLMDEPLRSRRETWRRSVGKAATVGAVVLILNTAAQVSKQSETRLPVISIKKACAEAGIQSGARVKTEAGAVLYCP